MDAVHVDVESSKQAMLIATRLVRDDGRYPSRLKAFKCMIACLELLDPKPVNYERGLNKNYVPGSVERFDQIKR